jgi:hypothetical protein
MKTKIILVSALFTVFCLAQTSAQTKPDPGQSASSTASAQAEAKPDCPCCKAMAESKDAKPCCHHDSADAKNAKEAMPCCHGKDAASCMQGDKDKSASTVDHKGCCGDDHKGCCAKSDKTTEQAKMTCCGGSGGHCGMHHHEHGDLSK